MARPKKGAVNKSQAIRALLQTMGMDASFTEVAKQLTAKGIKVDANAVSGIKIKMKKVQGQPTSAPVKTTPRATASNGSIAMQG